MELKLKHCFIPVLDFDDAIAFYRDALGLEIRSDVGFETMRWVTVGAKSQPDLEIVLEPPLVGASDEDREAFVRLMAKGLVRGAIFSTDDCDALYEQVAAAGAEVVQPPVDQPYGVRDCAFRDPSGNLLRFTQALAQTPA